MCTEFNKESKSVNIVIENNIKGAENARGLTVIIDVFRAFSVECFLSDLGVKKILPVGEVEECFKLRELHPDYYLVGERKGIKIDGFDSGNSPSFLTNVSNLDGKTVVHSTSAGTQGIVKAVNASEIITGSLVNAKAIARYIQQKAPETVTLVCMGLDGREESAEDTLCAQYIRSLILGEQLNIHEQIADLKRTSGKKFFDSSTPEFPEADFFMCLVPDIFDFVLRADTSKSPIEMQRIDV